MKYVGNYAWWIQTDLISKLDKEEIEGKTKLHDEGRWVGHPALEPYTKKTKVYAKYPEQSFQQFFSISEPLKDNPIKLPEFPQTRNEILWWIVKLKPGQYQTVHQDPHLFTATNPVRYTMYLQDWQPGHIFIYKNKTISNYKAGDLFEWDDSLGEHAVVNLSNTNRYSLQISMQDKREGPWLVGNYEAFK